LQTQKLKLIDGFGFVTINKFIYIFYFLIYLRNKTIFTKHTI
jgi:hypothetical protein